jgi:hypothetical protein
MTDTERYNFKYHSLEDLETLIENLKNEIVLLNSYHPLEQTKIKAQLEYCADMIKQAEDEILERTLLGASNEGGCST